MDIGDVFLVNEVPHVVIEISSRGVVKHSEPLKDYICRTRVIKHEGQVRTIADVINILSLEYIHTIIK